MKRVHFTFIAALAFLAFSTAFDAAAFTADSASGTRSDGSSRFDDPDDKIEANFGAQDDQPSTGRWGIGNSAIVGAPGSAYGLSGQDCSGRGDCSANLSRFH